MYYAATTTKSVAAAADELEAAARKRGYGVLHSYDLRATLASKGVAFDKDVRVLEICNPQRAGEVLAADINLCVALPCRIAVYQDGARTTIGMIRPKPLLAALSSRRDLVAVAKEVETALKAAIDEVATATTPARASAQKRLTETGERLEARAAELRADIDRELRKYRQQRQELAADNVPDSGEASVADVIADVYLAEVDRDFAELLEVTGALRRVAAGTYGTCIDCGNKIEPGRLAKSPQVARCRSCQTAAERAAGAPRPPRL
jgi:uncharacterized protein (DUF302 family)/RNA polymerase-binding transcription factor DksA